MLKAKLLAGGGVETLYVDDLFQAHTRTGTGASATVTTGINLSAKGGMIWSKGRSGATDHAIYDTSRGATFDLGSNLTSAQTTQAQGLTAFGTTGHTWGTLAKVNTNAATYVDYVFAKAPKFFDVVTYTGNGANRTISHSLGQEVGMLLVKRTDTAADWQVYHRSLANTEYAVLNSTAAKATGATRWNSTTATTSVFSVGTDTTVNASGGTYVAYLFAHDTGTDGIVQCGTYTGNGSAAGPTVTLGWEPQYVMFKASSTTGNWQIYDTARGWTDGGIDETLYANLSGAADATNSNLIRPLATGFQLTANFTGNTSGVTYIYLAIRRSNKPPTLGTQVFAVDNGDGTAARPTFISGFPVDMAFRKSTSGSGGFIASRLAGAAYMRTDTTDAETANSAFSFGYMNGWVNDTLYAADYSWMFKRAPGIFDVVCYTGTGSAKTEAHGLGAVPELMIVKSRAARDWWTLATIGPVHYLGRLNMTEAQSTSDLSPFGAVPTVASFSVDWVNNVSAETYVAYLFSSKSGISKVGSYTGTGTALAIDCGFTTGARFVLIKRTDSTGDWYVWDTVRGIIAGNDPYLLLNSTAAEVTSTDYIDSYTSGFELSSTAPAAINASGGTYIYLAFA